ncbi:hypothetical protein [Persicitalea jodogahamensis]|uniref:Uncharacterized protein n=1 Tax=Persicitalea jodogahamensis TaxID=402147 RepID=A0A8J3DCJ6_9BACT|nr:hypothetical protein [Persicitalea jodogahamensis]GHB83121.1 hypothetical protein GCM10007390_42600 [Persicitalea jodogahamensis]
MNKKLFTLLLSGWMLIGLGVQAQASTVLAATTVKTEMGLFGKKKKKRKRYKGYKKPRSKKFLGIFKRKSSCGCPNT